MNSRPPTVEIDSRHSADKPPRRLVSSILLAPYGSRGDVEPFLALGRMLRSVGAQPAFLINPLFEPLVAAEGFPILRAGSLEGAQKVIDHPLLWDRRKGSSIIAVSAIRSFQRYFAALHEAPTNFDLIVSGSWNVAAAAFAEAERIPHVRAHITPAYLRSPHDFSLLLDGSAHPFPSWMRRWQHRLRDHGYLDKFLPALNEQRAACGLRPVDNFYRSVFCAHGRMALLFPSWFAPSQPEWPKHDHLGFTYGTGSAAKDMAPELEEFLSSGPPPILWTFGSLFQNTGEFEACAWSVSKALGRRAIFVGGSGATVPPPSSPDFLHTSFLPLAAVLPRCGAIVHHGGIGTIAAAIDARVPQLAIPMAHDQPDNAIRMARLGLGKTIPIQGMTVTRVSKALRQLLSEPLANWNIDARPRHATFASRERVAEFFLEP